MSIQPLILKNGIITPPRSPTDINLLVASLSLTKANVNLSNVDNTSDLAKPVSTATQTALDLKANVTSPNLLGTPTVPTATSGTNNLQIANTAFVSTAISNLVASSPGALDTLNELAAALGNDANFSTTVTNSLANKVDLTTNQTIGGIKTITATYLAMQSVAPGFWLDETDGGLKGAYIVLNGGSVSIQRRATNFGLFEANIAFVNVNTGVFTVSTNVASTSTTTGTFICGGGAGFNGTVSALGLSLTNLPTSPSGLSNGAVWRNGTVLNIV
jgi:hypothetical protein